MFHEVLGLEMRTCIIFGAGRINDPERAILIGRLQIGQQRVQPVKTIQRDGLGFCNCDARPCPVVAIILKRRDHV